MLLITDGALLWLFSASRDRTAERVSRRYQGPETEAAKWNSTVINLLLFTCVPFLQWLNVFFSEKGLLLTFGNVGRLLERTWSDSQVIWTNTHFKGLDNLEKLQYDSAVGFMHI